MTSNWGRDFSATTLEGRLPLAASTLSVIRLAADDGEHSVVGGADTGISAEGIAISPDGSLIATINMQDSNFPEGHPRHQRDGVVSLLALNGETGAVEKLGDYPFEGVLPEGASFDLTGDHLLATVFEGQPDASPDEGPGLEIFRVLKGEAPALESIGRVPLPHGVHPVDVGG